MKKYLLSISIFILAITLCSCGGNSNSSAKQTDESVAINQNVVPEIDLTKDYEKKEIFLKDYLDIEYIPLETNNNSLVYRYTPPCVSDKYIIAASKTEIKIFDNKGKFINTFEHIGKADNEYSQMYSFCVDFNKEEIFIYDKPYLGKILVYSFDGSFKRKLSSFSKYMFDEIYNYNDEYLIVRDRSNIDSISEKDRQKINLITSDDKFVDVKGKEESVNNKPYCLISKKDGAIKELPLKIENRYGNTFYQTFKSNGIMYTRPITIPLLNIVKKKGDIIISEFALDTVYKYSNDNLTPILTFKNRGDKQFLIEVKQNNDKYLIVDVIGKEFKEDNGNFSLGDYVKTFVYNKQSKELFDAKIIDEIEYINNYGVEFPSEYDTYVVVDALKLITLNEDGKLTGKLQEIASELDEEDNPVIILGKFRQN